MSFFNLDAMTLTTDDREVFPVVALLDTDGEHTDDRAKAKGLLFKWPDGTFGVALIADEVLQ